MQYLCEFCRLCLVSLRPFPVAVEATEVVSPHIECDMTFGEDFTDAIWLFNSSLLKMAIEIVDFPIKNGDFP